MTDQELRNMFMNTILSGESSSPESVVGVDIESDTFYSLATEVIAAYQNATKWLDTIKEELIMTHGCLYLGNYIHQLAHAMPERFDDFGNIMHMFGFKVPYPTTEAINGSGDMSQIFDMISVTLDNINVALAKFIHTNAGTRYHSAASAAEDMMIEINRDIMYINHIRRSFSLCPDILRFDMWVKDYVTNLGVLLD